MSGTPDDLVRRSHRSRGDLERLSEAHIHHPLNPASDVYLKRLAPIFGLERLALHLARVQPGKESFLYHRHEHYEEFLAILSGRGLAEIDDKTLEVDPGDIMVFPAPDGLPHHLINPFDQDCIYLMGGESAGLDVAHFPKLGRHLVFTGSGSWSFDDTNCQHLTFSDWRAKDHPETPHVMGERRARGVESR